MRNRFTRRDYITNRAISISRYLIKNGVDPKEAIEITISKYIKNPKLNINKLIKEIKKETKQEFYYEDDLND